MGRVHELEIRFSAQVNLARFFFVTMKADFRIDGVGARAGEFFFVRVVADRFIEFGIALHSTDAVVEDQRQIGERSPVVDPFGGVFYVVLYFVALEDELIRLYVECHWRRVQIQLRDGAPFVRNRQVRG